MTKNYLYSLRALVLLFAVVLFRLQGLVPDWKDAHSSFPESTKISALEYAGYSNGISGNPVNVPAPVLTNLPGGITATGFAGNEHGCINGSHKVSFSVFFSYPGKLAFELPPCPERLHIINRVIRI